MSTYGYLAHHGIKGQKWGIRRYENPDGTLTEAGKKRYGSGLYTKNNAKKLLGNAGRKAAARRYSDLQRVAKESVKADIKANKVNKFDAHEETIKRTYNEYQKRYSGKMKNKQEVGVDLNKKNPVMQNFMRDQAAYKIQKYKKIDTVQNIVSAISSVTIGFGVFGSTNTKNLKKVYRAFTEDTVSSISNKPIQPTQLSGNAKDYIKEV